MMRKHVDIYVEYVCGFVWLLRKCGKKKENRLMKIWLFFFVVLFYFQVCDSVWMMRKVCGIKEASFETTSIAICSLGKKCGMWKKRGYGCFDLIYGSFEWKNFKKRICISIFSLNDLNRKSIQNFFLSIWWNLCMDLSLINR